jgi:hypothetical protein
VVAGDEPTKRPTPVGIDSAGVLVSADTDDDAFASAVGHRLKVAIATRAFT